MCVPPLTCDHAPTDTGAPSGAARAEVVPTAAVLARLLAQTVILPEEWEELSAQDRERLAGEGSERLLLLRLVHHRLLTPFQADWVQRGHANELIIDRYRLLDVLGRGGMGTVYRAEHLHLRRQVAIKVMTRTVGASPRLLQRFCAEARAVARIRHPNIVTCLDAGPVPAPTVRPLVTAEALAFTVSQVLIDLGVHTAGHWHRIPRYVRALAGAVRVEGEYARLRDDAYLDQLAAFAPTYDIGLLGVPRAVLLKPDRLDATETSIVQTHTTQGSALLQVVAGRFARELPGLPLAGELARSHHERWDGTGYPDALTGPEIPLSARVVAVAAVYEALRSRRPHRPPLGHKQAVKTIATASPGQFDPALLIAFSAVASQFEMIFRDGGSQILCVRDAELLAGVP